MLKKLLSCLIIICLTITCLTINGIANAEYEYHIVDIDLDEYDKNLKINVGQLLWVTGAEIIGDCPSGTTKILITRAHSSNENIALARYEQKNANFVRFGVYGVSASSDTATITFDYACTTISGDYIKDSVTFDVIVREPFQPLEFTIDAPERLDINLKPVSSIKSYKYSNTIVAVGGFATGIVGALVSKNAAITLGSAALGTIGMLNWIMQDSIRWEPYPAKLRVQVYNPNNYTVYGVKYTITTTSNGTDAGITFRDIPMVSEHFAIPPKFTKTITYELQPEIVYEYRNYSTDFTLEAVYKNPDTKQTVKETTTDSTTVYSHLSNEKDYSQYKIEQDFNSNDDSINSRLSDTNTAEAPDNSGSIPETSKIFTAKVITVQCPVNVNILDASGNVLATIESYDEEVFAADGIAAYAIDDAKAVVIEHEYLDSYRISIDAVGDGSMTITSVDILEDGTYAMSHHAEVPLTTGDTFSADISDTSVTRIYSGAGEEIAADVVINRETVNAMLIEAGYSEKWLASALEAVLMGLVTPELAENPQNDTTYEEYAAALLAMMENFIGVGAGYYANYFYELDGRTDMTAMDILAELGVTGMTDFTGDITSPITRGDMAIMTTSMLESMCLRYAFDEVSWTDVTNGNVAWSAGFMYDIGAMYCETEGEFLPTGTVTHEESIHALYMLWTYLQDPQLPPEIDPATEYTDKEIIKGVQAALNELGYDCGTPDGVSGANTAAAITEFQTVNELAVTGTITEELLMWLGWMGYVIPR